MKTDSAPTVQDAFVAAPRRYFLPDRGKRYSNVNVPVSIGFGQTNSQPYTVELMLEWLEVEPGDKVLDVGSGSGWTTALLANLTGHEGKVVAVEKIPELLRFGRNNCRTLGITNADFHVAGSRLGWPREAPYDRILVSASARELPVELIRQLKSGGKMVVSVGSQILVVTKYAADELDIERHVGFSFVPLEY